MLGESSQRIDDLYLAGDRERTRAALHTLLDEELDDALYPFSAELRSSNFRGREYNADSSSPLRLKYLLDRNAARQALRALLDNDLWRLCERFGNPPEESPRQHLRRAIAQADFRAWFRSKDGVRELLKLAKSVHRRYLGSALDADDAAQMAFMRIDASLPVECGYIFTTLNNIYRDQARKEKRGFHISMDVGWDDEDADEGRARQASLQAEVDRKFGTGNQAFTLLRRQQLFGLLAQIAEEIPQLEIKVTGMKKARRLTNEHQRIFRLWMALLPSARIDPELSVDEMVEEWGIARATLNRRFQDLQVALAEHPRYEELLELMLPFRLVGTVPDDWRARIDHVIREERAVFHNLVAHWKSEMIDQETE